MFSLKYPRVDVCLVPLPQHTPHPLYRDPTSSPAGTHYEAFNGECCFEAGSSLATCRVPLIDNDACGDPDRQFTCRLKPDDDQMACEDVATATIKDDDSESTSSLNECVCLVLPSP